MDWPWRLSLPDRNGVVENEASAIGIDGLACDVGSVVTRQESGHRGYFARLAAAADGGAGENAILGLLRRHERFRHHFSQNRSRPDTHDANIVRREGNGGDRRNLIESAFRN